MGIEPTQSAWKAEVLPLNYTRSASTILILFKTRHSDVRWREKDSNLRRLSRQIYSLLPLTARESLQKFKSAIVRNSTNDVNCRLSLKI